MECLQFEVYDNFKVSEGYRTGDYSEN